MGETPDQMKTLKRILKTDSPTYKSRYYWDHDHVWGAERKRISDWVSLEKGKSYYMVADNIEWTGYSNFDLSVEIEQTVQKNHHNKMRVVQNFEVA